MSIYITRDGTWGNAQDLILIEDEDFATDAEFQRLYQEMLDGADGSEMWDYFH